MTREQVKAALPILQAFAEGKTVQCQYDRVAPWCDCTEIAWDLLLRNPQNFRIKPEPREWWQVRDHEGNFLADFGNLDAAQRYALPRFGTVVIRVCEVLS